MEQDKIRVVNLTKKFGDLLVLNNISFNIKKGEFVCVVGPTGCGKTTFLNLLTRLIPPTEGQAQYILCLSGGFRDAMAEREAEP